MKFKYAVSMIYIHITYIKLYTCACQVSFFYLTQKEEMDITYKNMNKYDKYVIVWILNILVFEKNSLKIFTIIFHNIFYYLIRNIFFYFIHIQY